MILRILTILSWVALGLACGLVILIRELEFYVQFGQTDGTWREYGLSTVAIVFSLALLPAWSLISPVLRRRKRKKLGLCVKCGYDLRASKERCPECGTPIELKIMRKWLAILSLIGLTSSIFFGQMFKPLSPGIVFDDASIYFSIPWAKMSYAFAILTVYFLLHLFSDRWTITIAKCAVLITLCLGLSVLLWVVLRCVRGFGGGPMSGFAAAVFFIYVLPIAALVVTILVGCPMSFFLAPSAGRKFMLAAACFMVLAYLGIAYLKYSTSGKISPFYEIISTSMILTSGALWVLMRRPIVVEWSKIKKRRKASLCVKCGYGLRGSEERCPECGTGFSD